MKRENTNSDKQLTGKFGGVIEGEEYYNNHNHNSNQRVRF